jgi:hypothetical protein
LARVSLPITLDLASEKNLRGARGALPEAFKAQGCAVLARENFLRGDRLLCAAAQRFAQLRHNLRKNERGAHVTERAAINGRARACR